MEIGLLGFTLAYAYNAIIVNEMFAPKWMDKLIEHVQGIPFAPSLIGMPTYLPPWQVLESIDKSYPIDAQSQQSLQQISSQCHEALRLDSLENNNETYVGLNPYQRQDSNLYTAAASEAETYLTPVFSTTELCPEGYV
ncbi:Uncharacterized protein Fot_03486 [Forsythia ovata]|uniref:Uncharacterized protein n=1 Tax=Forsythia ovata TaxID=205694 RepID=A0ABD1X9V1_9LAMI